MKTNYLFTLVFLFSAVAFAQVPSYYNDVNLNLSGQNLKAELTQKITETQTTSLSYTPGVWDALRLADLNPNNSNEVILIYGYSDTDGVAMTDRTRDKNMNGGAVGDWNREHVFPKSLGNPNLGTSGPGSDAHHLRPADTQKNGERGSRKFAAGNGNAGVTAQGNYYPGDEFKGDVARMMMFVYLRYGSRCLPSAVGVGNGVSGDAAMIDLFLQWNVEDPVNAYELNRNDVIAGIQGNRNPFIDNPAFATQIWNGPQAEDRFGSGSNPGDGGTGDGETDELLISEYIEGSSLNKAIEVANFTGTSKSLSGYSLRKQTNGAGAWSSDLSLSGSITQGDVFVVANSSATAAYTSQADLVTSSSVMSFNGNDVIGLFKNGSLIDIVGTFNGGSANFGQNTTLRRKSSITTPSTAYNAGEWDTFPSDTSNGLGAHSVDGTSTPNTGCSNGITSFPYTESFESNFGQWSQSSDDDINWTRDASGTPSGGTGPTSGAAGNFYLFVEASGNGTAYPNKTARLESPCFTIPSSGTPNFTFSYHANGTGTMGSLSVQVSTDKGASWSNLWSQSNYQGTNWKTQSLALTAFAGQSIQLRFTRTTGNTWQADVAIDNVKITTTSGGSTGGGDTAAPSNYCASNGNSTNDEYIQRVQLGSINNSTGASAGGYGNFTTQKTILGSSNTITITPRWTGTIYNEGYAVFIDWNRDGDFTDAGERVFSRAATTVASISGSFSIPSNASVGDTRMRVAMKYNAIPTACESFQYGEVEDYEVTIPASRTSLSSPTRSLQGEIENESELDVTIVSKSGQLTFVAANTNAVQYTVYAITGQQMTTGAFKEKTQLQPLATGVYISKFTQNGTTLTKRFVVR